MDLLSATESRDFSSFLDAFGSNDGAPVATQHGRPTLNGNGGPSASAYGKAHVYSPSPKPNCSFPSPTNSTFSYSTVSYQTYSPTCAPLPQFYPSKPSPLASQDLPLYPHPPALPSPGVPLLPYQTHKTAAEMEMEKQHRMRQQTLELADWMRARGVVGSPGVASVVYDQSNGSSARGYGKQVEVDPTRSWSAGGGGNERMSAIERESTTQRLRQEQEYELLEARPTKRRAISNTGEEQEGGGGVQETMGSLHEAEMRAGFSRRVESVPLRSPPIQPPSRPTQQPPPIAPTKRKSPTGTVTPTARVVKAKAAPLPPIESSDPTANPGPASTPANIPPAPPRPPAQRPIARPRPTAPVATTSAPVTNSHSGKPALLSTAQKKANHIASEQKRRKAIRGGYEALCSTVPSLRAAVEEFEERVKKAGKGKRNGDKGALMGGIEVGGEKVDGRAGPRSEAVVLGKCTFFGSRRTSSRTDEP